MVGHERWSVGKGTRWCQPERSQSADVEGPPTLVETSRPLLEQRDVLMSQLHRRGAMLRADVGDHMDAEPRGEGPHGDLDAFSTLTAPRTGRLATPARLVPRDDEAAAD